MTSHFPNYANPPVVETVLGVQFERLSGWTNAHAGAFWTALGRDEWPSASDAPYIQPQFERFTEGAHWAKGVQLQLSQIASARIQLKNRAGDRMIQVQNGRLHFNWMGGKYPRYNAVRDGFSGALSLFLEFVEKSNVGKFLPNQWEVTYFNNIPKGTLWRTSADWKFFQPLGAVPTIADVIQGESFTGEWHFTIPGQRGRLHIEWQHALKSEPEQKDQEMIRLTLTARGPTDSCDDESRTQAIMDGLDLGHETIVRTFAILMSDEANKLWGLKDVEN